MNLNAHYPNDVIFLWKKTYAILQVSIEKEVLEGFTREGKFTDDEPRLRFCLLYLNNL